MSDEIFELPNTFHNSLAPALSYIGNKIREIFDGSCLKQDKITFTHGKTVNVYIVYEINLWNYVDRSDPTLRNSLFGAVKLVKNADIDKYKYSGYSIGFIMKGAFSFLTGGFGKNVITFGADMSSSVHVHNKKKDISIFGEGPTQGLYDTTLIAEKNYSINLIEHNKKFCLSLHYNGANNYFFVNGTKICKLKAKDSEINAFPLCLGKTLQKPFQ